MGGKMKESDVEKGVFSELTGRSTIRGKLLWAFMVLIAFTLAVIAVTLVSQTYMQRTIDDLVHVHGKIARLSLETEKTLSSMQVSEKDFLLNYGKIGIRKAKEIYLNAFIDQGGEAYQTLYQIQQLATTQQDVDAAQSAMDSINEYLSAFTGTVNIIELRVDTEFGELVKLRKSLDELGQIATGSDSSVIQNAFYLLKVSLQEYLSVPSKEKNDKVNAEKTRFTQFLNTVAMDNKVKTQLKTQVVEFDKWFGEVTNTDSVIAARINSYQNAVKRAEPVIKSFLDYAIANESAATAQMEKTVSLVRKVVLAAGVLSVLLALLIAVLLSRGITRQVAHITGLLDEVGAGNFKARAAVVSNDELGVMATKLNAMLDNITVLIQSQDERDAIQESIMTLLEDISALTEGDFTGRAEVTEDMTGAIADSFNAMADQFTEIIGKVKIATEAVDVTAEDVAHQTMILAEKNIEQVKGVTETVDAIEKMVVSIREVADNAKSSAEVSRQSRRNAQEGAIAVNQTSSAMGEIREQINETARSIKRLGESSLEIGNIVQIIDDIADRTSILALNASIQAAMAGDAGHGFAVVADEVQRLADSSSNSTKQIDILVKSIQSEVKDVSSRIDESISKVVDGSKLVDGAHEKLAEIEHVSGQLGDLIEKITNATTEQVQVSDTISNAMQEVGEISRESSISSQDTAASMDVLSRTARDLRSAVDVFKIQEMEA